jgi:hypothetical protein
MRIYIAIATLTLITSAAPAATPTPPVDSRTDPGVIKPFEGAVCRDRIEQVRDERGLPRLEREAATPDEELLIKAVDKRIDGCSVMVMHGNTADVRQLPAAPEGPLFRRISGQ